VKVNEIKLKKKYYGNRKTMQQVPGQDGDKTKRRQARKASETTTQIWDKFKSASISQVNVHNDIIIKFVYFR